MPTKKETITITGLEYLNNRVFDVTATLEIEGDVRENGFIVDISLDSITEHSHGRPAKRTTKDLPPRISEWISQAIADRYLIRETGESYL